MSRRALAPPHTCPAGLVALLVAFAACSGGHADGRSAPDVNEKPGAVAAVPSPPAPSPAAPTQAAPTQAAPASARAATAKATPAIIGDAKMLDDGTIVLDLRHPAWSQKKYPPTHPEYASVLRHLGGLRPGESKGVPPWPDDIDDAKIESSLRAYLPTKGLSLGGCRTEVMGSTAQEIVVSARCGDRPLSLRLRKGSYEVVSFTELGAQK